MKKLLFPAVILLTLLSVQMANAQAVRHVCGTHSEATTERLDENLATLARGFVRTRGAITYIPVKYILVARTNNTGQVAESSVLDMHCQLNTIYADQDIQFYIKDGTFKYVKNDAVYNNHVNTINTIMSLNKESNALNIFMVNDATPPNQQSPGVVLAYYSQDKDWIVCRNDQANKTSKTLAHEVGHFFSLPHTFKGYEPDPFGSDDAGWPIAPVVAPDGTNQTEKMDRSNCATAADKFCDTPPDYNFGLEWPQNNCTYTGGAKDPNGTTVDPDETNIMSYFSDACTSNFSPNQKAAMAADIASAKRAFLRQGYNPPATTITNNITPVFPQNGALAPWAATFTIDWEDVAGATHYVIQFANNPAFQGATTKIVNTSSADFTLDISAKERKHYWRLRPFNPYYTCLNLSPSFSFTPTEGSAAKEIPFVQNFSVAPNPAIAANGLRVNLISGESFDGEMVVADFTGKILSKEQRQFVTGVNEFSISLADFQSGMYLLAIRSEEGVMKKKIIVNR